MVSSQGSNPLLTHLTITMNSLFHPKLITKLIGLAFLPCAVLPLGEAKANENCNLLLAQSRRTAQTEPRTKKQKMRRTRHASTNSFKQNSGTNRAGTFCCSSYGNGHGWGCYSIEKGQSCPGETLVDCTGNTDLDEHGNLTCGGN